MIFPDFCSLSIISNLSTATRAAFFVHWHPVAPQNQKSKKYSAIIITTGFRFGISNTSSTAELVLLRNLNRRSILLLKWTAGWQILKLQPRPK
jgi:hypothetical protein